ncbi:chymotrypsin-C-like [Plodia interpunctella]|uniref:chymotrypsin-C-like n=1 Tax=Plodia interpunctella TaxID=58824 RepID=UPI0023681F8E|nr:chymotrypsin-C-like [Plodia interpunctella]
MLCYGFLIYFVTLFSSSICGKDIAGWGLVGNPVGRARPCKGNNDIEAVFESGLPPEEENKYDLQIYVNFPKYSRVHITFDSEATVTLHDKSVARISTFGSEFHITFFKSAPALHMSVKGPNIGSVPYPTRIEANGVQFCKEPNVGFLDNILQGYKETAHTVSTVKQTGCGRRKVQHTELIFNGQPTKPGDWPWHAAVYRLEYASAKYVCGGTLISKNFVLTAGHCVTINGAPVLPEIVSVILGKYNLIGGDVATQERLVHQVIVHEEYYQKKLDNDIALVKLKTEAIYDDYVQPACLWNIDSIKRLPAGIVYGTVVGWGLNHTEKLSSELHQVSLPKIGEQTCLKSNPNFFGRVLNYRKFCAGYTNGTSACNGDSGGGFLVFIPDIAEDTSANATGAWYINGIVSLAVSRTDAKICDTTQYTLFTNVHAFTGWIDEHIRIL